MKDFKSLPYNDNKIIRITNENKMERLVLHEITAEECNEKEFITSVIGTGRGICAYIAAQDREDFFDKVKWYYINKAYDSEVEMMKIATKIRGVSHPDLEPVRVDFYGEKRL